MSLIQNPNAEITDADVQGTHKGSRGEPKRRPRDGSSDVLENPPTHGLKKGPRNGCKRIPEDAPEGVGFSGPGKPTDSDGFTVNPEGGGKGIQGGNREQGPNISQVAPDGEGGGRGGRIFSTRSTSVVGRVG